LSNNKKFIDLHIHTNMSDGSYSPEEIVLLAKQNGISAIAITDHDTFEGVEDAMYYGAKYGIEVIAGVEIGIDFSYNFGVHGLAYFFDNRFLQLQEWFFNLRNYNVNSFIDSISRKVIEIGIPFSNKDFMKFSGNKYINIYCVFDYISTISDYTSAFEVEKELFTFGKPCFIEGLNIISEIIRIVKDCGGKLFLSHPFKYGLEKNDAIELVKTAKLRGFDGIEVYNGESSLEQTKILENLSKELKFLITGGSDFHGENKPNVKIGIVNNKNLSYEILEKIRN